MAAIEDGLYQPAMKARMNELERDKAEIVARMAQAPADVPDVRPNIADLYRRNVERFTEALHDPDGGREAAEALRSLIGEIVLTPGPKRGEVHAELRGELMGILAFATTKEAKRSSRFMPPVASCARFGDIVCQNYWIHRPQPRHGFGSLKRNSSSRDVLARFEGRIWSNATGPDGKLLVGVDPDALTEFVNTSDYPIYLRHDPGHPLGKLLEAAVFKNLTDIVFALMGFYVGRRLSFSDFGFDPAEEAAPPAKLPPPPDGIWIDFAFDRREVAAAWVNDVIAAAPIEARKVPLSFNALDAANELIRAGVLFMTLVWTPFVIRIANEAAKDTYAAIRRWLVQLSDKLSEFNNPVLEIQAHHGGCRISFLLRGGNIAANHAAMEMISAAAAQAERLIARMEQCGKPPKTLVFEFDKAGSLWHPSYAELYDGHLVTDSKKLMIMADLPTGLSLGLMADSKNPFLHLMGSR